METSSTPDPGPDPAVESGPEPESDPEPASDMAPERVRAVLADADALGGFFAISTRPEESADPSWRPVAELFGPVRSDDDPLARRIDEVAAQLGASRRVAASLLELSLSARATAIVLAAVVEHGVLPLIPPERLCWRPWPGGPIPLWIDEPGGRAVGRPVTDTDTDGADGPGRLADAVAAELDRSHLRPLVDAIRARASVSPRVMWGNAASSMAGAVRVLALERPHTRDTARALAAAVLARPPLDGLGGFVPEPAHPTGFGFARRTCCLFHRVPGGGVCGDCVLRT